MKILAHQRGSETVEFALVAVWFFFIVFLIIETSLMIREYNTIALVAQEGARRGSMIADVAEGGAPDDMAAWVLGRLHGLGIPGTPTITPRVTAATADPLGWGNINFCIEIQHTYRPVIPLAAIGDLLNAMPLQKESCMPLPEI